MKKSIFIIVSFVLTVGLFVVALHLRLKPAETKTSDPPAEAIG